MRERQREGGGGVGEGITGVGEEMGLAEKKGRARTGAVREREPHKIEENKREKATVVGDGWNEAAR